MCIFRVNQCSQLRECESARVRIFQQLRSHPISNNNSLRALCQRRRGGITVHQNPMYCTPESYVRTYVRNIRPRVVCVSVSCVNLFYTLQGSVSEYEWVSVLYNNIRSTPKKELSERTCSDSTLPADKNESGASTLVCNLLRKSASSRLHTATNEITLIQRTKSKHNIVSKNVRKE